MLLGILRCLKITKEEKKKKKEERKRREKRQLLDLVIIRPYSRMCGVWMDYRV